MRPSDVEDDGTGIVQEYRDVGQRMNIHKETIDQIMDVRQQFKDQVFRPGHNMPTKSLEALADEEYEDAMRRQV